jgi:hypothetical protein
LIEGTLRGDASVAKIKHRNASFGTFTWERSVDRLIHEVIEVLKERPFVAKSMHETVVRQPIVLNFRDAAFRPLTERIAREHWMVCFGMK